MLRWNQTMCSKYGHQSKVSGQFNWEAYLISWGERKPTLWPTMAHKSLLWIWNLKWQSAWFAIANGMRQVPIGSNSQNICGVGIVDTIDPHTLILCKRALGGDFCILWPAETECWREVDLIRTYTRWMFNHIRHNSTNLSHNVKQHLNIESVLISIFCIYDWY